MAEITKDNHEETRVDLGHKEREHIPYSSGFIDRISRLIRSQLARVAARVILAAGGAGTALSACTPAADTGAPNKPVGTYGTQTGALTLDQVINVGPGQPIPWSVFGDESCNYAKIGDEHHIFVAEQYVKCKAMEDCLSAGAEVQTVQGLIKAGLPYITMQDSNGEGGFGEPYDIPFAGTSGAFQDAEGNNKLLVESEGGVYQCDITPNADAVLEAANCAKLDPPMWGSFSIYRKNNVAPYSYPYALWIGKVRELAYGTDDKYYSEFYTHDQNCGPGFEAVEGYMDPWSYSYKSELVVDSDMLPKEWWEDPQCRLIAAKDWKALNDNPIPLDILNAGSKHIQNPRLADGYILYTRREDYKDGFTSRLWFAKLAPAPENPEPDTDAVDAGAPDTDDATSSDTVIIDELDAANQDTGPETDDSGQPNPNDVSEDIAEAADAAVESEDATTDTDIPPDPSLPSDAQSETETQSDSSDVTQETNQNSGQDATTDTNIPSDLSLDTKPDTSSDSEPESESNSDNAPNASQTEIDISSSTPEIVPVQNTSTPKLSTPPQNPDNGGCQTGPNSSSSDPGTAASILTAITLLTMRRRRQKESQQSIKP